MCPTCDGLGTSYTFRPRPAHSRSEHQPSPDGAVPLIGNLKGMGRWRKHIFEGVGKSLNIDLKKPWEDLKPGQQNQLLHGSGDTHIVWGVEAAVRQSLEARRGNGKALFRS